MRRDPDDAIKKTKPKKKPPKPTPVPISEHAMTAVAKRTPKPKPSRASTNDKEAQVWTAKNMLPPGLVKQPKAGPTPPPGLRGPVATTPLFKPLHARVPLSAAAKAQKPSLNKQYQWAQQTLVPGSVGTKAKKKLAAAMTEEEKALYHERYKPLPPLPPRYPPWAGRPTPGRDKGLLDAVTGAASSIYRTNVGLGKGVGQGLWGIAGEIGRGTPGLYYGSPVRQGTGYRQAPSWEEQEKAAEAVFGKAAVNAALHGDFSHPYAIAAEAVLAGLPLTKAVRPAARGVAAGARAGARGARAGYRSGPVQRLIHEETGALNLGARPGDLAPDPGEGFDAWR